MVELAVGYRDRARGIVGCENAVLIVREYAAVDRQVRAFGTNAGPVAVGRFGSREGNAAHRHIVGGNHENRLTLADGFRQNHSLRAALDREVVGRPYRTIMIGGRFYDDGVARLGHRGGLAWHGIGLPWAHHQCRRRSGRRYERDQNKRRRENLSGTAPIRPVLARWVHEI